MDLRSAKPGAPKAIKPIGPRAKIGFLVVGILPVAIGLFLIAEALLFQYGARRVDGERVRIESPTSSSAIAIVRYEVDGKAYEVASRTYGGRTGPRLNEELARVGPIPVLYRPEHPEAGRIATPIEMWGLPLAAGVLGLVCVLIGVQKGNDRAGPVERKGGRNGDSEPRGRPAEPAWPADSAETGNVY